MAAPGASACCTCRESQLYSECCRVGLLRRSARVRRRSDGADHISALPDDLLLQILVLVGCARAAACTSLLSRRWRGLWAHAPVLLFHNIGPEPLHAALARVARPAGALRIFVARHHALPPPRISSLLAAAALLAPAELAVDLRSAPCTGGRTNADAVVDLPCFDRATSLTLHFVPRPRLPPAGDFTALGSLSLFSFGSCAMDLGGLLARCPCLRNLCLSSWKFDSITVHSPSLQELDVDTCVQLQRVDIMTPILKKLKFSARHGISNKFTLSLTAPMVDDLSWWCRPWSSSHRFGVVWRMSNLKLKTPEHLVRAQLTNGRQNTCFQPGHRPHGDVLLLDIWATHSSSDVASAWAFEQEISRIPARNISVLELNITTQGHVYGAMVLDLLRLCTSTQKLKMILNRHEEWRACSVNCHCDQPDNWEKQIISLTDLKEVKIEGFKGEGHEVGFLKVLLRCAAMLQTVNINLARNVP